jgi:hypothetical protein
MAKSGWDATRHEDSSTPGTPDVSWGCRDVNGWMELKVVQTLGDPKKNVKIKLRPLQRVFLIKRSRTGSHCSVLLWVTKTSECLLFTTEEAFRALETLVPQELHQQASVVTKGLPEPSRFLDVLTGKHRYGQL